ncbi:multicopper oxidase family protein [Carnobacterium pleistocenium]|uniref:multicopper oxidase family protein n=1 Tax=Carnobacterium pleistocenium TaxID=181073 RepID=UPI00054F155A|nr:multicopper oxidase domain-containing protein [Carnobacterium pleistocenium]
MKKNKLITLFLFSLILLIVVSIILILNFNKSNPSLTNNENRTGMFNNDTNSTMGNGQMRSNDTADIIDDSQIQNKLKLPPLLESDQETSTDISYTLTAQAGTTAFKDGPLTETYGYNGSYLGPILRIRKGQNVHLTTVNKLNENTSFHWHGLQIPSNVDGGPHSPIQPNGTATVDFTVMQEAATLWFHPHPEGRTGEQVYNGLAGLIYIEDENSDALDLPKDYGINDFPIIVQDRFFDENNQFNYQDIRNMNGTNGDTLLVNGTIGPYIEVKNERLRLRLVNGSNARNYQFNLSSEENFYQIASDGGFLNEPVQMDTIQLVPGERAEIVVDLSAYKNGDTVQVLDGTAETLSIKIVEEINSEAGSLPKTLNDVSTNFDNISVPDKELTFSGMGNMVAINGKQFDMNRIDLRAKKGITEIWEITNLSDMMSRMIHPFHLHGVQFKVLDRNGEVPPLNEHGWKDTIALYPGETVRIAVEFSKKGIFMYHCHILEHEDNGMMGQILVE